MIIVRLEGGLGNQMFQYALGKSLSHFQSNELKLDITSLLDNTNPEKVLRDYSLDIFNLKVDFASKEDLKIVLNKEYNFFERQKIKWLYGNKIPFFYKNEYYERELYKYDPYIFKSRKNVYITGYWQHPNYFSAIDKILINDFSFKNTNNEKFINLKNEILQSESVALNIRRADLVHNKNANEFMGVMPLSYYEQSIRHILKKKPNSKFFIFSDDLEWCKKSFKNLKNSYIVENDYYGYKFSDCLYLMSSCNNFIIPNSTFAWWAVWLNKNNERIIVQPRQWVRDNNIDTSGIVFKNAHLV